MEQRAKVAKKTEAAGVYRKFIEEQKKKTKEKNKQILDTIYNIWWRVKEGCHDW